MNGYFGTTKAMDLGVLAADTPILALSNPAASGKNIIIKKLTARCLFIGVAALSKIAFGVTRATGTAAGGSGNASGATVGKRNPGNLNAKALLRWGPAAITGLTPDAVNDVKTFLMVHQNVAPVEYVLMDGQDIPQTSDPFVIVPGTSLAVYTRDASIAGSIVAVNVEWSES